MESIESVENYTNRRYGFNLAGIIPIAGYENEYGTVLPDYLNPLAPGYFPVQKSVMECAFAGCDTIWVICNHDYMSLVKKYIGDSVLDPITYEKFYFTKGGKKVQKRKTIPIMYISMHHKYLNNCSIPFSVVYGAYMVKKTTNKISKWVKADRYFTSFMNQQYDINHLYDVRKHIRSYNPFLVSHNTKTVVDGITSAFTFDNNDLYDILKWSKIKNNASIQDVFSKINIKDNYTWEPQYAFDTKTWQGLREYLGSPFTEQHKVITSLFPSFTYKPLYKRKKNESF
jgi:hypothetical protein